MSQKNRPSVLKRERERKKRERAAGKAQKAALKRARREGDTASQPETASTDEIEGNRDAAEPSTDTDQ